MAVEQVTSLTDFRSDPDYYFEELSKNKRPLLLTRQNKSSAVLLDTAQYQALLEQLAFMKSVADGLEDVHHKRLFSMDEVFDSVDRIIAEAEKYSAELELGVPGYKLKDCNTSLPNNL